MVPINVAPLMDGHFDPATIVFERDDGTPVQFELRGFRGSDVLCSIGPQAELVPLTDLAPNVGYSIRAQGFGLSDSVIRFETGNDRVPDVPLAAPVASASLVERGWTNSCSGDHLYACVSVPGAQWLEVWAPRDNGDVIHVVLEGTTWASPLGDRLMGCIEVRARDAAGRRSEVTRFCEDELPIRRQDRPEMGLDCVEGIVPGLSDAAAEPQTTAGAPIGAAGAQGAGTAGMPAVGQGAGSSELNAGSGPSSTGCSAMGGPRSAPVEVAWMLWLAAWIRRRRY